MEKLDTKPWWRYGYVWFLMAVSYTHLSSQHGHQYTSHSSNDFKLHRVHRYCCMGLAPSKV